jgi:hypothetical protein
MTPAEVERASALLRRLRRVERMRGHPFRWRATVHERLTDEADHIVAELRALLAPHADA